MSDLNRASITGRISTDPVYTNFPNGGGVLKFSVATEERWTDKQQQQQTKTDFHFVEVFGKIADIARERISKGMTVQIEGALRSSSFDTENGKRYTYTIHIESYNHLFNWYPKPEQPENV